MGLADRWITLFNKPIPNVILRLVVLFGGFLSMAMSIALMRTTGLGNSPISCIPATLSYLVPLTLGTITFIMNTCFLVFRQFCYAVISIPCSSCKSPSRLCLP